MFLVEIAKFPNSDYLIEKAVEDAKKTGEIQNDFTKGNIAISLLKSFTNGKRPSKSELLKLSHSLDMKTEDLMEICDRVFS